MQCILKNILSGRASKEAIAYKTGTMLIKDRIIDKIHSDGPISFHDFMEMALYYPGEGYYTSSGEKIGCKGDYYTSPYLGNAFGIMIGKQVEEMWSIVNEPHFTVVEYGAGNGALCYDILAYLEKNNVTLFNGLVYYIIEKSPAMIEMEKVVLNRFAGKIKWIDSIRDIGNVMGCILSNEVIDNFSVHRVLMQDELIEIFVGFNDRFVEIHRPAAEKLKDYLLRFNITLPKGYRTEINLQAEKWITEITAALKKGFVLTIDYGYTSDELYHHKRASGTMLCYHDHTVNDDPFLHVGEQDITTHINFSALLHAGVKEGLLHCGLTGQSSFLNSLGLVNFLRQEEQAGRLNSPNDISAIAALMNMGRKFKVFIQQKGLGRVPLSGMKFPQPLL